MGRLKTTPYYGITLIRIEIDELQILRHFKSLAVINRNSNLSKKVLLLQIGLKIDLLSCEK